MLIFFRTSIIFFPLISFDRDKLKSEFNSTKIVKNTNGKYSWSFL